MSLLNVIKLFVKWNIQIKFTVCKGKNEILNFLKYCYIHYTTNKLLQIVYVLNGIHLQPNC